MKERYLDKLDFLNSVRRCQTVLQQVSVSQSQHVGSNNTQNKQINFANRKQCPQMKERSDKQDKNKLAKGLEL